MTKEQPVFDVNFDEIVNETEKAWCVLINDEEVWLPKSQVEMYEDDYVVVVPEWLMKEKGL